jgi:hypothetical protein
MMKPVNMTMHENDPQSPVEKVYLAMATLEILVHDSVEIAIREGSELKGVEVSLMVWQI